MANERNRSPYSSSNGTTSRNGAGTLNENQVQGLYDRIAALRQEVMGRLASSLAQNPQLADAINLQIDQLLQSVVASDSGKPPPPDKGLAQLIGLGPEAANDLGKTRSPLGVEPYDESIASERIVAVGDLYYIYQHERIGVFRVMRKLQELFKAGMIRLSGEAGAYALYQFDRREVLRSTRRDRLAAYQRVFGYGTGVLPAGARANTGFHDQFTHFVNQVALFWRDTR